MNNSTKTILSLLFFFPLGIYFYSKSKSTNLVSFLILLMIGFILFIPFWTIILSNLVRAGNDFQNNILLPLIGNLMNK